MKANDTSSRVPLFKRDTIAVADEFERRNFANRVARSIVAQPLAETMVVSIVGSWGSGKSTVLDFIRAEIAARTAEEGTCRIAPFNPWRYSGEDALLFELFESLVKAIDPDKKVVTEWQHIREKASQWSKGVSGALAALANLYTPGSGELLKDAISIAAPSDFKTKLEDVRDQTSVYLGQQSMRVVVLLDDIDRLDGRDILLLFRAIKLIANLPNTIFVIAMDEEHVSQVIGQTIGQNQKTGRAYIEKIVNVRLALPAIPAHILTEYALNECDKAFEQIGGYFPDTSHSRVRQIFQEIHAPFIRTPRTAKAIVNAYAFALGLLPNEVNAGDLLLLEATRILHPKLCDVLREEIPLLKGNRAAAYRTAMGISDEKKADRSKSLWSRLLNAFAEFNQGRSEEVKDSLQTWFPQLSDQVHDEQEEWNQERRICSNRYFWRYFAGAIHKGDVHDAVVENWVARSIVGDNECVMELERHLSGSHARAFVAKMKPILSNTISDITPALLTVALVSRRLPDEGEHKLVGTLRALSREAVASIVARSSKKRRREQMAIAILKASDDIRWNFELIEAIPSDSMVLRTSEKEKPKAIVSLIDRELALQSLLVYERGELALNDGMICRMMWAIARNIGFADFRNRFERILRANPSVAVHAVAIGCTFGSSERNPKCWRWDPNKAPSLIQDIIDLGVLGEALQSTLGDGKKSAPPGSEYQTLKDCAFDCLFQIRDNRKLLLVSPLP